MTGKNIDERATLNRLADLIVEDIMSATDEEVLSEFRNTQGDPLQHAVDMRNVFEKTIIAMNKQRLVAARIGVDVYRRKCIVQPSKVIDMDSARKMLGNVLESSTQEHQITLAARKETEMSDADVISMIEDIKELGVNPSDGKKGS